MVADDVGRRDLGRRAPLSRESVLAEGVALADEGGLAALSMRRLAGRLGVEAMSLYNHVSAKDDLLDGMVDLVAGEMALPAVGADWKAEMRARATSAHAVLLRHPWSPLLFLSRINTGPAVLARLDATIGCLVNAGFSYAEADHAWNAIDSHVFGFTLQMLNFPFAPEEYARMAAAYLPMVPEDRLPYMRALTIEVAEGRHDGL